MAVNVETEDPLDLFSKEIFNIIASGSSKIANIKGSGQNNERSWKKGGNMIGREEAGRRRKGKERKGKERKGKERKGKERK